MRAACRAAPLHGGESGADHPRGAGRGNGPGDGRHRLSAVGPAAAKESIQSFDLCGIILTDGIKPVLEFLNNTCSVADPGSGAFLTPGSGIRDG